MGMQASARRARSSASSSASRAMRRLASIALVFHALNVVQFLVAAPPLLQWRPRQDATA